MDTTEIIYFWFNVGPFKLCSALLCNVFMHCVTCLMLVIQSLAASRLLCRWWRDSVSESAGRQGRHLWIATSWVASPRKRRSFWTLLSSRAWTSCSPCCLSNGPSRRHSLPPHQQGADMQHRKLKRGLALPLQLQTLLQLRAEVSKRCWWNMNTLMRLYLFFSENKSRFVQSGAET